LLLAGAFALPVSLLWDFSWESTVGIDKFFAPPHVLTFAAMLMAAVGAAGLMFFPARGTSALPGSIQLLRVSAPPGAWLVAWGALAFATAVLFDRWWQSAYGLGAGIWHPPQMLKATTFFATLAGVWFLGSAAQRDSNPASAWAAWLFPFAGGLLLVLIAIVTITQSYPNRQHSASFHQIACATYPLVLAALAGGGRTRWPATTGALVYFVVTGAMVWLLPLIPARPLTGPIYNPLDHLMPPPFPLLLVVPALGMDLLLKKIRWPERRGADWLQAGALGLMFFLIFLITQWVFAGFLLSPAADHWFFAGGGKHWPFFLKISPAARVAFWETGADVMNGAGALRALGLALIAVRLGLWLGAWMKRGAR
jgi:hypothetical protein